MKILITGAGGQLGHELRRTLAHGSELGPIPEKYVKAEITCVDVEQLDIADTRAVDAFFKNRGFDVVFNCAAYANVDGCEARPDQAFLVNALGARNLALAAEQYGAKLVHVSTDYVFAGDAQTPYCEWDLPCPQSVYGKSKYLGEQYVRDFCSRYFIVRTSWLYGHRGGNFVRTMLRLAREKGGVRVVNDQRGNPTNAADLAYHLLKLAVTKEYGIYHCTGKGECSWYEFACKIIEFAGIDADVSPCTSEEFKSPTKRPAYSCLDHPMLRCTVGDEMRNWQEALRSFFANDYQEESRR